MKLFKTAIIATIITCLIIISCSYAMTAHAEDYGEFYPRLTIVFQIEYENDQRIIYCQDKSQNVWIFYDDDNIWAYGDICNLLMLNNSTDITQHEIIEVYWEGYTDNISSFFSVTNWRK